MANLSDAPPTGTWFRNTITNFVASAQVWGGQAWGLFAWGEKGPSPSWTRTKL